jgi:hypothetical protein
MDLAIECSYSVQNFNSTLFSSGSYCSTFVYPGVDAYIVVFKTFSEPVMPALKRLRQEDQQFVTSLGFQENKQAISDCQVFEHIVTSLLLLCKN